jgi:DNA-binding NarL/FixJ family response regulator
MERNPDVGLMLVDWNMPEMNGLDLIRTVRARRAYDAVRILMVTSEAQGEQVTRALNAGANEYLMKPFNKDVLVALQQGRVPLPPQHLAQLGSGPQGRQVAGLPGRRPLPRRVGPARAPDRGVPRRGGRLGAAPGRARRPGTRPA